MKNTTLQQVLTPKQIREVIAIVEDHNPNQALRRYMRTIDEDLKKKDIHPDYLAEVVIYLNAQSLIARFESATSQAANET